MTHINQLQNRKNAQSGFTLLELLLVIGVTAVMFLGITKITADWMSNEVSSNAGQHMQRVSTAVQSYIQANWVTLAETSDAVNGGAAGWTELRNKLDQEGLLINGNLRSPLGPALQISFTKAGGISRAVIFTTTPVAFKSAQEAARQTGNSGGTLAVLPEATNAYGAYGQWRIPRGQLYPASAGAFPCNPTNSTSCLISLVSQSDATLCNLYLYRVPTGVASCAGNTMTVDLNMNNQNITNANNIRTQTMDIAQNATLGNMTVEGTTTLNGATNVTGNMTVTGGEVAIASNATFSGDVQMSGGGNLVAGSIATGTISADRVEATNIQSEDMNVTGPLAVADNLTINGDMTVNGSREIYAASLNTGQIEAGAGTLRVGSVDVRNNMLINNGGSLTISGGTVYTEQMAITRCTRIISGGTQKTYGTC